MKSLPGGKGTVAGVGAAVLAIVAVSYLGDGKTPGSAIKRPDQSALAAAATVNTEAEALANHADVDTEDRTPAATVVAAAFDAVSIVEAAPGDAASASTGESDQAATPPQQAPVITDNPASQRSVADTLLAATRDASPEISLGPFTACFDQMRAIACPIVGTIPVIKDVVGRLSLELGISCPTSSAATRT